MRNGKSETWADETMGRATIEKLPPHDTDAEEAVIATAMVDPEMTPLMLRIVQPADFFREQNRWIWQAVATLTQRDGATSVNQITVANELSRLGKLKDAGGAAYLSRLVTTLPTSVAGEHYARLVRDAGGRRRMIGAASHIVRLAYDAEDVTALMGEAMTLIESVARDSIKQGAVSVRQLMHELADQPPVHQDGVVTDWIALNEILGSLRRGSLYILAARPSHGKSSFALSLLRDVLTKGQRRALLFSLEMSRDQVASRLTAATARVPSQRIEERVMDENDQRRVTFAQGRLGDSDGWLNDRARSLSQIEIEAKAHSIKHGLDIVIVDYLQLVEVGGKRNRTEEVSLISRRLKTMAMDMDIPILALSQLSRAIETRSDSRPMLSDLRESGSIEQDADAVIFLYDGQKRPDSKQHQVEVIVAKNRMGRVGSVKMTFNPSTASFLAESGWEGE